LPTPDNRPGESGRPAFAFGYGKASWISASAFGLAGAFGVNSDLSILAS